MKIRYLLCAASILLTVGATAQLNSDDPSFYDTGTSNPVVSNSEAKILSASADTACANVGAIAVATGECGYAWASDPLGLNSLYGTDTLFTGPLPVGDTVFYVASTTPVLDSDTASPVLPPHGSVYSGNVRGYYFQVPVDMKITKLRVPTEASTGSQNVAVLNFGTSPPPLWASTTNAFVEKGYWQNFVDDGFGNDTIYTCIDVYAGQYIGIYGNRTDNNSYASAPWGTHIAGDSVTFYRSGMQNPLSSNPMANVFAETGGSISRTAFWYTTQFDTTSSYIAVPVTAMPSYEFTTNLDICTGDSALIAGNYYFSDTTVTDSLATMVTGCDSLYVNILTFHAPETTADSIWICQGDSALVNGVYYGTAGLILDTLSSMYGCDSTTTVTLFVDSLPAVTLVPFTEDTMCVQLGTVSLPAGIPAGGTYSGIGVSGANFDASISGVGTFTVTYTYTDTVGCPNTATTDITVNGPPTVTLAPFTQDTMCIQWGTMPLPTGTPIGGAYSGTGVSGADFDASISGIGTFTVTYTFIDALGCTNTATTDMTVNGCVGVDEHVANLAKIYPNPANDQLTIDTDNNQIESLYLTDALGRIITSYANVSGIINVDVSNYAAGIYFVVARNGNEYQSQRFVKK
ncbi:MAG: T9SS type A sorting domain-containing protein [Flavobacteriales bacterium]|nr:T9SS type A sorting domain-containing protein [Flavobacteriales bacterium]